MTHTLVRERHHASDADEWDVVGEVVDPTFDVNEDDLSSEPDWIEVTEDPGVDETQEQVATILDLLLDAWEGATAHQSSIRRATEHPFYKLILRADEQAIPHLLDRLARDPNPLWIWALGDLSGEDPAAGSTTVDEAADAWLRWGAERTLSR